MKLKEQQKVINNKLNNSVIKLDKYLGWCEYAALINWKKLTKKESFSKTSFYCLLV